MSTDLLTGNIQQFLETATLFENKNKPAPESQRAGKQREVKSSFKTGRRKYTPKGRIRKIRSNVNKQSFYVIGLPLVTYKRKEVNTSDTSFDVQISLGRNTMQIRSHHTNQGSALGLPQAYPGGNRVKWTI